MYKTWASVFGFGFLMFTAVAWTAPDKALYCQADTDNNTPSYTKLDGSGNALSDSAALVEHGQGQCHRPDLGSENQ